MSELNRDNLTVEAERVFLVGVLLPDGKYDERDPLGELRNLAKTAGANVVDEMIMKKHRPNPGLYVGSGKATQLAGRCEMNEVDVIIFDNDLSPAQIRELEKITGTKVLDRSELILDIFASHASTAQARLQVELAQLEYTYPRLTGMWTHLDRHGGGIGTRGPGERQIETDRRIVQRRMSLLKKKLGRIEERKLREVRARDAEFCVCLVGYTNVGKSTLMNRLTGEDVYIADQLFATLETCTRKWDVGRGKNILLSDTVGFIRDLPHHLVASFRATLEEAIFADLLIHVADASSDRVNEEVAEVQRVLDELGCGEDNCLMVLNKIDKIVDPTVYQVLRGKYPDALFLSAGESKGLDAFAEEVLLRSDGRAFRVRIEANCCNGKLMHAIARLADIESQEYVGAMSHIEAVLSKAGIEEIRAYGGDVEIEVMG